MRGSTHAWLLQLLLLSAGSLRQGAVLIAGQDTASQPAAPPNGSSRASEILTDCPAELVLALLKQSRELKVTKLVSSNQASSSGGSQESLSAGQPGAFPWPPPALKQGLACTMELSQLSVAVPGTNKVCTVLGITNNLLSILHSWQLVWQQRGMVGEQATRATLLNSTATGDNTVQLINPPTSPSIPAQCSVDMLVQLATVPAPPPPTSAPSNSDDGAQNQPPRAAPARRPGSIRPAVESVFLNGLQCTRLPLARPTAGQLTENSLYFDDCGTADWPIDANGTLGSLGSNGSFMGLLNRTANVALGGGNATGVSEKDFGVVVAALRQLSCVSQLCCGLQVVPNSVVTVGNSSSDAANSTEPPVVATDGPAPDRSTSGNASQVDPGAQPGNTVLPTDITPVQPRTQQDNSTVGLVVGLVVAGVVVGCLGALMMMLLRHRHNRRKWPGSQLKQQAAAQQALVRHRSGASSNGSGGAASLASLASAEWQQQQQHYASAPNRPPVPWLQGVPQHALPTHRTAPPHLITEAAVAATAELSTGGVWRAGSWQGPDTYTPAGTQLERSSSSPQPLQRTATGSTGTHHPTQPAMPLASSNPSSPSTAYLHLPPAGPSRSSSQTATAFAPTAAGAFAPDGTVGGSSPGAGGAAAPSAGSSPRDPLGTANYSSLNSTWGSLRRMLGNNKAPAPKSSTLTSATSSNNLTRHSSHQGPDTREGTLHTLPSNSTSAAAATTLNHITGAQREALTQAFYRPPLQLIQEAAPLSGAAFPAHGLSQQQLQLIANTGQLGFASGRGADGSAVVSRRISPILSVLDDASSATSTDSMTPAAWHLTDRQMLEDTPGWLNIDFASEVRLEKKLGEGGFGQVFRARWHDEVIAAKLVPFMSLVAQQHHSMALSLVSAAVGTPDPAAAGAGQPSSSNVTGTDGSQLGNMRLGVQFSSGSLRAIKVEIRVLSQLSHPNIVAFKGACLAPPHICILEELAEGGSLYSRLYSRSSASKAQQQQRQRQQQQAALATAASSSIPAPQLRPRKAGGGSSSKGMLPPPLSVSEVLRIAINVSHAMVYLHTLQPQVVHRDLKPQNVLLDLQGMAKVCDFGISKMKDASLAASSTRLQAGTPAYMAPEQFEGCSVTDKVDVFAFGVLLWECFEQQQPWKELSPMQIIYSVGLQKERLQRPARCPDQLWQLIEACWAQDPRDRPSFADTLQTLQHLQQELSRGQQEAAAESPTGSSGQKQQSLQQQQAAQPEVQQQAAQPQEQQQGLEVIQHKDQLLSPKVPASAEQVPPSDTDAVACTDQSQGGHEDVDAHVAVVC